MDNAQTTQRQQVSPARRRWGLLLWLAGSALLTQVVSAIDKSGVSPNTVSLPRGPGSIEGLGEGFAPLLSNGTGKYAVGLWVPPGPAGHAPTLGLRYDGGNGNGPLGFGWRLDMPFVQRRTYKGIPRYVDGNNGIDDDGDGETDEADEVDVLVDSDAEELVPVTNADGMHTDYFRRHESTFVRYRRLESGWEGRLPDGTYLEFGVTAAGRLADGARVWRWLLERAADPRGNTILFLYHSVPDAQNTHQVYLSEVRYGAGPPAADQTWPGFHFVRFLYEPRPDWSEDCRPGFVVRTGLRLTRIVVGTQGPDVAGDGHATGDYNQDGTSDSLDRAYRLAYDADPHWSLLSSITPVGADNISTLPPVCFTYTTATCAGTLPATGAIIGVENEPVQVMDLPWVDLLDFNGDGLPDILRTDPLDGPHTVYFNQGEVAQDSGPAIRWSAGIQVGGDARAWTVNLADSYGAIAHLADMDADGLADLVLGTGTDAYYFPNAPSAAAPAWQTRQRMVLAEEGNAPPVPFGSAEVRTADLDFDKALDIVQSVAVAGGAQYRVWFNLDGQRYSRGVTVAPEVGFRFSDVGVHIADMNGDRLPDLARVRAADVWVTAGLGHGRFATLVPLDIPDWTLTDEQVRQAVLQDVTGDGLADLVVERAAPGELWTWVNRGNYTLGTRCVVTGLPAQFGTAPARRWADLNGNGTIDLVTADGAAAPRVQALDIGRLLGCVPTPHLLVGIDNGLGRRITIDYTTTTAAALVDAAAGTPWPDPLPFPVDVVAGVTVDDTRGTRTRTGFTYHEGYYDPPYRQFSGFARVEQTDVGDESAPTLVSSFLFHTGKGDRTMRGNLLGTTIRQADGAVFQTETTTWSTRMLYAGMDGREVRFAHPASRTRDIVELATGVPRRIETEFEVDDYGNETVRREYGVVEGADRAALGDERITETQYAYNLDTWLVRFPMRTRLRDLAGTLLSREQTYYDDPTFSGTNLGAVTAGLPTLVRRWIDPAEDGAFIEAVRTHYDAYGNPVALLDPLALAPLGAMDDGVGHYRTVDYDEAFHTYPVSETIHLEAGKEDLVMQASYDVGQGRLTTALDPNGHTTAYGYDVFGRLAHILRPGDDPGYPSIEAEYVLGYPVGAGRSAQDPPSARSPTPVINWVETRRLDQAPGTAATKRDHYLISRAFVDGLGRQVMAKAEAEDDPQTGTPRVVVEGAVRFNARGTAALTLNPFYTLAGGDLDAQLAFEDIAAPDWQGSFHQEGEQIALGLTAAHATRTFYDATLRVRRTVNPDGSATETAYVPLGVTAADENDTDPASPYHGTPTARWSDGLGRLNRVDEIVRLNDDGTPSAALQTWSTAYQYRADGALTQTSDAQGNTKAFGYDALGRKTILRDPDRGTVLYTFDAASNLLHTTDAKNQTVAYTYDGANRLLTETYAAGGKGALPPDPRRGVTDSPDPSSLARGPGHASATTVEGTRLSPAPVLAPVERQVLRAEVLQQGLGDSVPRTNAAHVTYHYDSPLGLIDFGNGEAGTAANTRGRLAWVQDLTGEEHTSYDERGREAWVVKCIPDPINGMPVPYRTALTYDAMDRLVERVYPDEDRCTYEYNHRGLLERITGGETANLAGTPYLLAQADYAPSGQPVETLYGNGVRTTHRYDARLRQTRLRASPSARTHRTPATPLIDFSYSFDSASNLLRISDLRDGTERPAGDPRRNTQILQYDDLYRLTRVQYSLALPGAPDRDDGQIAYRYDRIGNLLAQTSDLAHADPRTGLAVCDLGTMASGGDLGTWDRIGRTAGDPPGPHALTSITHPPLDPRLFPYDANGNLTSIDGLACTWDVLDRLVAVEDESMRAEYAYDYTGRRIWKRVWQKDGAGVPEAYPSTTTLYVGSHFEVREFDQPTKVVFAGDTRVATVTGSLNGNEHRTQRLRLFAGWNLLALAVSLSTSAPLFAVASAAFLWDPDTQAYTPVGPGDPLAAGAVLWVHCGAPVTLALAGPYVEPSSRPIPVGGTFVSGPPLAAWQAEAALPAATRTWRFAAAVQQWEMDVPTDLAFLSPFPAFVAAGEPVFVVSSDPSGLILQPSAISILYYHQDHLGSSAIIANAEGNVVDETAYYPFGYPRHHDRPEAARAVLPTRYGFTQKEQDAESGLQHFGARFYAPALARWLSPDPAPAREDPNLYAYARGNPLRFVDSLGLEPEDFHVVMVNVTMGAGGGGLEAKWRYAVRGVGSGDANRMFFRERVEWDEPTPEAKRFITTQDPAYLRAGVHYGQKPREVSIVHAEGEREGLSAGEEWDVHGLHQVWDIAALQTLQPGQRASVTFRQSYWYSRFPTAAASAEARWEEAAREGRQLIGPQFRSYYQRVSGSDYTVTRTVARQGRDLTFTITKTRENRGFFSRLLGRGKSQTQTTMKGFFPSP